jgi:hypothetical protein
MERNKRTIKRHRIMRNTAKPELRASLKNRREKRKIKRKR